MGSTFCSSIPARSDPEGRSLAVLFAAVLVPPLAAADRLLLALLGGVVAAKARLGAAGELAGVVRWDCGACEEVAVSLLRVLSRAALPGTPTGSVAGAGVTVPITALTKVLAAVKAGVGRDCGVSSATLGTGRRKTFSNSTVTGFGLTL